MKTFRKAMALLLTANLLITGVVNQAFAGMITFATAIANEEKQSAAGSIDRASLEASLVQRLEHLGVDPADAAKRVGSLTDEEFRVLAHRLDHLPAAGGVLEVVGITFLVLLILELVGVIDIFKRL